MDSFIKRKRGRPVKSPIRQNIIEILFFAGKLHGYELYKHYSMLFPEVSMRSIYYHLNRGVNTNQFVVSVEKEKGNFSWGSEVEKKYYSNGPTAKPIGDSRVKTYFEEKTT